MTENNVLQGEEREKYIKGMIDEGINALLQSDSAKELLGSIVETGSEKTGMDKAAVRKLIAVAYTKQYKFEKYSKDKDITLSMYEILEEV